MAKLEYFLVCESVSVDQTTNTISVFHVLEQINSPQFPFVLLRLTAVAHWNAEEGDMDRDFQVGIVITSPDGQLKKFEQNFRMIRPRHRTIANLMGFPLTQAGTMTIEVTLNGEHRATHTIDVRKDEASLLIASTH